MSENISSLIGMISGLIAIYSFVTGTTSLKSVTKTPDKTRGNEPKRIDSPKPFPYWIFLFIPSLIITLVMGLAGDDASGIMFFLLLISSISIILYSKNLPQYLSRSSFILVNVILLAILGYFFGAISRGEEEIGLIMGIISGIGVGIIILSSGNFTQIIHKKSTYSMGHISDEGHNIPSITNVDSIQEEKQILIVAERLHGEIKITDVALQTSLPLDKAKDILESLQNRGYCEKQTSEAGATIYIFKDFQQ